MRKNSYFCYKYMNRSLYNSLLFSKSYNVMIISIASKNYSTNNILSNVNTNTTTTIATLKCNEKKINEKDIKPDISNINSMIIKYSKANDRKSVMECFYKLDSYNSIPNQSSFEKAILMYIQLNDMVYL